MKQYSWTISVMRKSRGFGFVEFIDSKAVDKALLQKPYIINGRTIEMERAVPKENMQAQSGSNSTANSRPPPLIVPSYPTISSSTSSYSQQGINSNVSHFNPPIPRNAVYSQSFDSMNQNQSSNSNYIQPPQSSYRQNQQ
ncbi:unnamed protein product [Rotaria sordida]|uniref:RRM domain-containing protein n=1 Tax=Rotaria sordida TaxID=392033 RepID=A0A815VI36_9BILA|nr:unnamed protein product [Rotaria sordida]